MLRWIFGVLYVKIPFYLPSPSLLYLLVLFLSVWEFAVSEGVVDVGDIGDCLNDYHGLVRWLWGSSPLLLF